MIRLSTIFLNTLFVLYSTGIFAFESAYTTAGGAEKARQHNGVSQDRLLVSPPPEAWLSHGRTPDEQRFSPLRQINDQTVAQLNLAWSYELPTRRGVEATPLVADGILYTTGSWSIVYAFDAISGELLWSYDPKVPRAHLKVTCCGPVNRGVALWQNKIFVATLDGRLVALDRASGQEHWSIDTLIDKTAPYSITGAPRIANGKVIIGNGGAEMGVRGYVSAYDAQNGKLNWRFFTVPGNPALGFEDDTQQWIATTWSGEWWKEGGGGTAWDSFAFDPEINLLYIGVGNGSPWNHEVRSPGGGDNLFLASIVAVNADTGKYVWHYQLNPGETWDFTATQSIILADIEIDGRQRKVLMQAPKNGFFYVIDRISGELLLAEPFAKVNWASHIDLKSGRPVEHPRARSGDGSFTVKPSGGGAHNWNPMAFNPTTGLAYIPARNIGNSYQEERELFDHRKRVHNPYYSPTEMASVPDFIPVWLRQLYAKWKFRGFLSAFDPKSGKEIWRQDQGLITGGGVLTTAGNLVFQGNMQGKFSAYNATDGEQLWSYQTENGIMGGPISFEIEGVQYIAVMQGWGGISGLAAGLVVGPMEITNVSRVLVFKLGGTAQLKDVETMIQPLPKPTQPMPDEKTVEFGKQLYGLYCMACHGGNVISGGVVSDLRFNVSTLSYVWDSIVLDGLYSAAGMPAWKDYISKDESKAILDYVIYEAHQGHKRGEQRALRK